MHALLKLKFHKFQKSNWESYSRREYLEAQKNIGQS